jgi:16S rRNA (cytosine967-C5)-methyltransferase
MTTPRLAAAQVLIAIERGHSTLAAQLERARTPITDPRDVSLLMELATGVTRWRLELDGRLKMHLRTPLAELAPEVRAILRMAAYQLHHLDRIPEHAIVNESVELTRTLGQPRAAGFVNAVLRNLIRAKGAASGLPARPDDNDERERVLDYLSITLSHPRWLVARWLDRVGFEACERWCQFNNASPDVTLRAIESDTEALLTELTAHGIEAARGDYVSTAVRVPAGALSKLPADLRRRVTIQDEASQLVACAAGARPSERVLDVCAAPGGKTLLLAHAAGATGFVVAADRRHSRVRLLRSTLAHAGVGAPVLALDALVGLPFTDTFDRVLLDAPCSGLGTIRRDPDIKWNRAEPDLGRFAEAQHTMVRHAARVVKPGGSLIYSTCSSEPDENDVIIDAFLAAEPDFSLAPLAFGDDCPAGARVQDERGVLRTWPFVHGLDAFFAARLVRRERA